MIRKGNQPLQQIMRRCSELEFINFRKDDKFDQFLTKQEHFGGPICSNVGNVTQYKILESRELKINCNDEKNSYLLIDNKYVIKTLNIIQCNNNEIFVIGKKFKIIGNIYNIPCLSSDLGINIVNDQASRIESWPLNKISAKLFVMPYESNKVTFPILHTYHIFRTDNVFKKSKISNISFH